MEEWFSPVVPLLFNAIMPRGFDIRCLYLYLLDGLNCFNLKHTCNSTNSTRNDHFRFTVPAEKSRSRIKSKPNYWPIYKHQNTIFFKYTFKKSVWNLKVKNVLEFLSSITADDLRASGCGVMKKEKSAESLDLGQITWNGYRTDYSRIFRRFLILIPSQIK